MLMLEKILDKLGDLEFQIEGSNTDLFDEPEPGDPDFDAAIPLALNRARDNIFVAN